MLDDTQLDNCLRDHLEAPRWLVGYSGGVDSTVLLAFLARWCEDHPGAPPLFAIHVNHQLQQAAAQWQAHCQAACEALGVPLISRAVDVVAPGEAGARAARYRVFEELIEQGDVLFLAHHLDDQVETFFLRLLRGAGLEGLASIPQTRPLGGGVILRPLLQTPRAGIEDYARVHQLPFVEDPSNADSALDRNYLRREVLPQLAARWPAYRQSITRAIDHVASATGELQAAEGGLATVRSVTGDCGVSLAALVESSPAAAARRLRGWLSSFHLQAPDQSQLQEFLRQLREGGEDSTPELNTGSYQLRRFGAAVYLVPQFSAASPAEPVAIAPGDRVLVPGVGAVSLLPADKGALALAPKEQLSLCWRSGGEAVRPAGRGGSTTLKKLLQEAEVPPWWRARIPILFRGEDLLAVGDICVCEAGPDGGQVGGKRLHWQLVWERDIVC